VELVWSKRRILEVYLNVAEFDTGVFGVEAAARHYFGVSAADLTPVQAARLAAILPDPKGRSASEPSRFVRAGRRRSGRGGNDPRGRARGLFRGLKAGTAPVRGIARDAGGRHARIGFERMIRLPGIEKPRSAVPRSAARCG
jgi:hypothetical protein